MGIHFDKGPVTISFPDGYQVLTGKWFMVFWTRADAGLASSL